MKNTFTLLLIHFWFLSFGQTFTKIPLDNQLIPRDLSTNKGNAKIEGSVNASTNYTKLRVEVFRNTSLLNSTDISLNYT